MLFLDLPVHGLTTCRAYVVLASLSGPGGSTLRIHNVLTGVLLHETRLHAPSTGQLTQPPSIGVKIAFLPGSDDVFVLTNGRTVTRFVMDAERGGYKKAWEWTSLDQSYVLILIPLSRPTELTRTRAGH